MRLIALLALAASPAAADPETAAAALVGTDAWPGVEITGTVPFGGMIYLQGTVRAAPDVSGLPDPTPAAADALRAGCAAPQIAALGIDGVRVMTELSDPYGNEMGSYPLDDCALLEAMLAAAAAAPSDFARAVSERGRSDPPPGLALLEAYDDGGILSAAFMLPMGAETGPEAFAAAAGGALAWLCDTPGAAAALEGGAFDISVADQALATSRSWIARSCDRLEAMQ